MRAEQDCGGLDKLDLCLPDTAKPLLAGVACEVCSQSVSLLSSQETVCKKGTMRRPSQASRTLTLC